MEQVLCDFTKIVMEIEKAKELSWSKLILSSNQKHVSCSLISYEDSTVLLACFLLLLNVENCYKPFFFFLNFLIDDSCLSSWVGFVYWFNQFFILVNQKIRQPFYTQTLYKIYINDRLVINYLDFFFLTRN